MSIPKYVQSQAIQRHLDIVLTSYEQHFREPLISCRGANESVIEQLWRASFVLLSHGTEDDPVFNFGNKLATELFAVPFKELIRLPSRKSAQPVSQAERNHLLRQVTEQGFIDDYRGVRISATGRRFYIENARVWNLYDGEGQYYGQAAMFSHWRDVEVTGPG